MIRINPYVVVVGTASAVAVALAGVLFFLLPNSQQILAVAQRRLLAAPAFAFQMKFASAQGNTGRRVIVDANGLVGRRTHGAVLRQTVTVVHDGAPSFSLAGELILAGNDAFFAPSQFASSAQLPVNPSALVGSWLHLSRTDLAATGLADFAAHDPSDAERTALRDRAEKAPYMKFVRKVEGTLFGSAPYHYKVEIQEAYVKDIAYRWRELHSGRPLDADERDEMDALLASVEAGESDIWIGKDYFPQRLVVPLTLRGKSGEASAVLDIAFSRGGIGDDALVPDGPVVEFGDALAAFAPAIKARLPLAGDATTSASARESTGLPAYGSVGDGEEDIDNDGLSSRLEAFYGTDADDSDTDGDGTSDGDEVAAGNNPTGPGRLFDFGLTF